MKKKVKKFAVGGTTGFYPAGGSAGLGGGGGLRGIIDTAQGLVGDVSGFGDKIIGGKGGLGGNVGGNMTPITGDMKPFASQGVQALGMKSGGKVKNYAKGGKVSSASKRADGCAVKGKTRGRMV